MFPSKLTSAKLLSCNATIFFAYNDSNNETKRFVSLNEYNGSKCGVMFRKIENGSNSERSLASSQIKVRWVKFQKWLIVTSWPFGVTIHNIKRYYTLLSMVCVYLEII